MKIFIIISRDGLSNIEHFSSVLLSGNMISGKKALVEYALCVTYVARRRNKGA